MIKRFCSSSFHSLQKKTIFQNKFYSFTQAKDSFTNLAHKLIKDPPNIIKFQENGLNFTIPFEMIGTKTDKKTFNSDFLYKLVSPSQV